MRLAGFLQNEAGSAATEFALIVPLMILLLFAGSEAGHFVWTQHKLTEGVRNGVRYASRLPIDKLCDGPNSVLADPELSAVIDVTRTGRVGSGMSTVPGWTAGNVSVTVSCEAFVGTGIYTDLEAPGPIVTVRAQNVPYPSLFKSLGRLPGTIRLNATANTAGIGL